MNPPTKSTATGRPHIVVTGLMGVGKTTVGGHLADALGLPHRDSDRDIERLLGRSGRELAERHGIDELHRVEASVLLGALASTDATVISAAGWVVEDDRCREAMARLATVVVLEAPIDAVAERMAAGDHRRSMDRAELERLAERRGSLYRELADVVIDAGQDPDAVRAATLAAVGSPQ